MDIDTFARRLVDDAELRERALTRPGHVVRELHLDPEMLRDVAPIVAASTAPHADTARAALFALIAAARSKANGIFEEED